MRAELPTVHAVAPTSHIGPILAPAQTMDNSRDRRPLYTVPRHVDSARRKCYNVAERGAISCVGTVPTVVATPAGAPTLKVRFRCPTNGGRRKGPDDHGHHTQRKGRADGRNILTPRHKGTKVRTRMRLEL